MIYETYLADVQALNAQKAKVAKIARTAEQYWVIDKAKNEEKRLRQQLTRLSFDLENEIRDLFIKNDTIFQGKQVMITNQTGETHIVKLDNVKFNWHLNNEYKLDGKFTFGAIMNEGYTKINGTIGYFFDFCVRDTPEQIINEINGFKTAVKCGAKEFTFSA